MSKKTITFTLDRGTGEQDLVDTSMLNIKSELEAAAEDYFRDIDEQDEDFFEVTIRIERKYTQKQLEEMPDYTG